MPGYNCYIITGERRNEVQQLLYICRRCGLILRDPVQNPTTGELACRSCIDQNEVKNFRQDKAINREIKELYVLCGNKECLWRGPFVNFEKHFKECERKNVRLWEQNADLVRELFASRPPLGGHHFFSSFEEDFQEEYVIPKADAAIIDMTQHVHPTSARHNMDTAALPVRRRPKKMSLRQRPRSCTNIDFDNEFAALRNSAQVLGEKRDKQQKELHHFDTTLDLNSKRINSAFSQVNNMEMEPLLPTANGFCKDSKKAFCPICCENFQDYSRLGKPEGGSAMQCYWEVLSNPSALLISPAFYTSPNGYSFRVYLYPNGQGSSAGKYVSVFMAPVPGAHDGRLRWPIEGTLTFVLLPQEKGAQMVIKNFKTIPFENPSLFKFNPEATTGWGCQDFFPVTEFLEGGYLKDGISQWEFQFLPHERKLSLL